MGVVSDQDAQRSSIGSRPNIESPLTTVEACRRLLDGLRVVLAALRARVQAVEALVEKLWSTPAIFDTMCGICLGRLNSSVRRWTT
ncbi:hypothetical protein PF005_g16570 [Phytophthora fragariae]|uniref:Uncharacterized protein n=1 Tax=Phytophthora fragariae TaxID=53985 RepID=A0A6A3X6Q6_9STRA|nr:hypothetical protein PF003_g18661 [Phytophthora fragariae]KAE9197279.1 hypothetical protein PF005_g16570 [Phytophthora fragariae]